MNKPLKLSIIALIAATLAAAPVGAVSLNLGGGGPLLDLGNGASGTGNTVVDVNTGAPLNGGGGNSNLNGLVSLGSNDDDTTAAIDLDGTGSNGLIDFDGSGDLIDLNGDDELVNLGRRSPTTARVGTGGTTDSDLLLNLFGTDDDANASLTTAGIGGNGIFDGGPAGDDVIIDLFGPANGGAGSGNPGSGNPGIGSPGIGGGANGNVSGNGVLVASLGDDSRCFSPSSTQIGNLVNRHNYTPATLSSWVNASNMKIVEIGLCNEARQRVQATLAADANVGRLQSHLNNSAAIRAGLSQRGHSSNDVVAIDRDGGTLIVYVI